MQKVNIAEKLALFQDYYNPRIIGELNNQHVKAAKLKGEFKVPYDERCMHEFFISGYYQKELGVSTKDMAKRLLDYGFHAPTIYFPVIVHESMLIEPTETEAVENLDSMADAFLAIAKEVRETPEIVLAAPSTTPISRVDDALAARNLNISYFGKR